MREFSKVSPALWASKRFNDLLSDDARYLYLYLLTCEHQTSAGVFKLKDGYAVEDLKWQLERFTAARQHLIDAELIRFDAATSVFLITRWFRHNPPMNDSHYKGVAKVIRKVPCEAFQQEAMTALTEAFDEVQVAKAIANGKSPPSPLSDASPQLRAIAGRNGMRSAA